MRRVRKSCRSQSLLRTEDATSLIDERNGTSECVLLDAKHIEDGPICRIALPHKICSGTHACWADRLQLRG